MGNVRPQYRSKIHNIQIILTKYATVMEFGIDSMLKPIVEDICKPKSVHVTKMHNPICSVALVVSTIHLQSSRNVTVYTDESVINLQLLYVNLSITS